MNETSVDERTSIRRSIGASADAQRADEEHSGRASMGRGFRGCGLAGHG